MNATSNGHSVDDVKAAARGRWRDILAALGGIDPELLDGRHHPCPKCGGTDRFSLVDEDAGAVLCRQCFDEKNGDGLAAIQWRNDWTFPETLKAVAAYLNIANSRQHTNGHGKASKPTPATKGEPSDFRLQMESLDPRMNAAFIEKKLAEFCASKPPITPEAVKAAGGEVVIWPNSRQHGRQCVAFPAFNRPGELTGYILRRVDGSEFDAVGKLSVRKTHMLRDSSDGWVIPGGFERVAQARVVIRVEGVPDALALYPHLPADYAVITNICGAKSCPENVSFLSGKIINAMGDADIPGQEGVAKFAAKVKGTAGTVKIPLMPYPVEIDHGKDLRDYFNDGHTFAELLALAEAAPVIEPPEKKDASAPPDVIVEDDDPHKLGHGYLDQYCRTAEGEQTIVFYRGEFWRYNDASNSYETMPDSEMRGELTKAVKIQLDEIATLRLAAHRESEKEGSPPKAKRVTRSLISNVLNVVESLTGLPSKRNQPFWLTDDVPPFDASEMLIAQNGLVHLPSLGTDRPALLPPTPLFFSTNSLGCAFDPRATCPEWMRFLETVWGEDQQSRDTLAEWLGYLLLLDVSHHKILLLVGPPRSGKGTFGRVLKALLGQNSVANPTMSSLSGPFGLWSLLNKSAAVISDARLSGQVDAVAILERLLSISGGDPQNVDRKCLPTVTAVSLPVRFTILTNELPRLTDAGGAIASRFVVLKMTRTFLGCEDKELDRKLAAELPGILNWAIRGWQRLRDRGRFIQPESGGELLEELRDLTSPVGMFIREVCAVGPLHAVDVSDIYAAWVSWCKSHGRDHAGTDQTFGKDLRAAIPGLSIARPRIGGDRVRRYEGVGFAHLVRTGPRSTPIVRETQKEWVV